MYPSSKHDVRLLQDTKLGNNEVINNDTITYLTNRNDFTIIPHNTSSKFNLPHVYLHKENPIIFPSKYISIPSITSPVPLDIDPHPSTSDNILSIPLPII